MNIYFSGLGGVGIGPAALIARDAGHSVYGSDIAESRYTELMREKGIEVSIGQDGSSIAAVHEANNIDWFIYTAALPEDHPELQYAKQQGIRHSLRVPFINHIVEENNLKLIGVAGTHGKTTTTAMIIWALKQLNIPVSYAVGTNISFGPAGAHEEGSHYFIYEADEYHNQFLELNPTISLITSLEHDHPDSYPTEEDYYDAFRTYANQSQLTIGWKEDLEPSGIHESQSVDLQSKSQDLGPITLPGLHNRQNAYLVIQLLKRLIGSNIAERAYEAINSFPGTERRFEQLANHLYSDYGHHPSEVRAVVQMCNEIANSVVVVYQPHQNMRQHEIQSNGGYTDAFKGADKVYWLPTYLSREDENLEVLTPHDLYKNLPTAQITESAEMNDDLLGLIQKARESKQLVVLITAGDADQWLRENI
jgi:UDP-N-acetylmuramate--alanine ligase